MPGKRKYKPRKNASKKSRAEKLNKTKNGFSYKKNIEQSTAVYKQEKGVLKKEVLITDEQIKTNSRLIEENLNGLFRRE